MSLRNGLSGCKSALGVLTDVLMTPVPRSSMFRLSINSPLPSATWVATKLMTSRTPMVGTLLAIASAARQGPFHDGLVPKWDATCAVSIVSDCAKNYATPPTVNPTFTASSVACVMTDVLRPMLMVKATDILCDNIPIPRS